MDPKVKINQTNFYVGLPREKDAEKVKAFKETGGTLLWVLSPEDAPKFSCPYGDLAVVWKSDEEILTFLFGHMNKNKQGELWGDPDSPAYARFTSLFLNIAELHSFDAHSATILGRDNQPMRNALRNYRWVEDGIPLRRLKGMAKKFKSSAIIVGAGPSLNSQWQHLKRIHPDANSGCIITVGRSYKMLMKHGVCPEFVVEAEQYDWNANMWYFAPPPPSHTILCCPLPVAPDILNGWPGQKCILVDNPTASMMKLGEDDCIDGGNSVAHIAFNIAVRLGCNPIYFAGIDLGYPDGEKGDTHADGTFHAWPGTIIASEHQFQGNLMVPSNDGGTVQSSQPYVNFKTFFELAVHKAKAANPDLRVYTFSKRGQVIRGVEYLELETWNGQPPSGLPSPSSSPSSAASGSPASVSSVGVPFPSGSPESTSETPQKP